jgi:hypothetical protein
LEGFDMPLRDKQFILARQPHETLTHSYAWSPLRNKPLFAAVVLLLMGLSFPMKIDGQPVNPESWAKAVELGLLKVSYGWNINQYITKSEAAAIYTSWAGKTPKTGCSNAQEQDWKMICPLISSQMSYGIDCANANIQGKADILRNYEKSKTTKVYACLYGN